MEISTKDKNRMIDFYNESIRKNTFDFHKVGWNSRESQEMRFEKLIERFELDGKSILDFGCGTGDLYAWLRIRVKELRYSGVDVNNKMIQIAKDKHLWGFFKCILKEELHEIKNKYYDYILASGVFSFKIKNYEKIYKDKIKELFECCNIGMSFNMLKSGIHVDDDIYATWNVNEVREFAIGLSDRVDVIENYGDFSDFTVVIHK